MEDQKTSENELIRSLPVPWIMFALVRQIIINKGQSCEGIMRWGKSLIWNLITFELVHVESTFEILIYFQEMVIESIKNDTFRRIQR